MNEFNKRIILSIIVFIIMILLYIFAKKIIKKRINTIKDNKRKTYFNIITSFINYLIIIIGILVILQINGFNVSHILAGLGIVSVITGLALQDALKDIIMGFNIIMDNYFSIGDVIKINNIEGKVLSFNLKCTQIRDLYTSDIYIISNRNIDKIINVKNQFDIDIPIEYEEKISKIENILNNIIIEAKKNKNIEDIQYVGINEFATSALIYKLRIWCAPDIKLIIKRYINKIIKEQLDENHIIIPYTKITINQKYY